MSKRAKKYIAKQRREYNPYCPICSGCGEEGCCSATCCKQHSEGKYCSTYLQDLQFGYLMYKDVYEHVPTEIMDKIWDKNYELVYERKVNRKELKELENQYIQNRTVWEQKN